MDTRVVITGVTGRMGAALVLAVRDTPGLKVFAGTARPGSASVGLDVGLVAHLGSLEAEVFDDLEKATGTDADVVIDFTSAEASVRHARVCAAKRVAMVVGSTGFSTESKAAIAESAKQIPIVMAPNMSVGVAVMVEIAAEMARRLGEGFDIEVLEAHHRMKKDAPSGTALRLAEELAHATHADPSVIRPSRVGQIGERPRHEIGVQTLRGGDVVGDHTVFFLGDGERLELTHRASSREQFARGAVRAAKWVVGKKPGLYAMKDVLKT